MTTPIDLVTSPLGISVLPHATKTTEYSVRQHATDRTRCKKLVRDAAEDPFAQSIVPVAAGHDQICLLILNMTQKFGGDRPLRLPPDFVRRSDAMAEKVRCDVGKSPFGLGFRFAFADSDEQNLFGLLQKRKCITHGAAALTCVLPRDHDAAELRRSDGVGTTRTGRPARSKITPGSASSCPLPPVCRGPRIMRSAALASRDTSSYGNSSAVRHSTCLRCCPLARNLLPIHRGVRSPFGTHVPWARDRRQRLQRQKWAAAPSRQCQ